MARYMTQQEKAEFHADFPQMNVQSTLVTGEATPVGGPLELPPVFLDSDLSNRRQS
jgi:hypothetical protein